MPRNDCSRWAKYAIYPLLVALDQGLDGPGHAEVLRADFHNALGLAPDGQLPTVRVGCARVRPLIVATVSDMEHLQEALARVSLKQVFDDYIAWMNHGSLNDFLAYNSMRLGIRESKALADQALEFLEGAGEFFFGTRDLTRVHR